jgi:septal ring factor EnvC (AmiA/AmiB activator)
MYEKIKAFFKKYKSIIITIVSSILTMLGINYIRNRAIERNLQRANEQLAESDRIIKEQQIANNELTKQLEQSRTTVYELEQKFRASKRTANELEVIDGELKKESSRTSEILNKLRNFIDDNSSTKQ